MSLVLQMKLTAQEPTQPAVAINFSLLCKHATKRINHKCQTTSLSTRYDTHP